MRYLLTIMILMLGALLLCSCSTGSDGPGLATSGTTTSTATTGQNLSPTVITTSGDGAVAAALVLQSKELAVNSTTMFKNLGFIAQSHMVSATTVTGSGSCPDYGTYDYNSIYNGISGKYNVLINFSLCREDGFQYDGSYSAYGKPSQFTGRLGGLKIMNFKNNYTTLIGSLVGVSVYYKMEGSGNPANATYTFTANGIMQAFDYYSLGQHTMTFSNLKTDYVISTDSNIQSSSIMVNGKYSAKHLTNTTSITYADFTVDIQKQTTTNIEDFGILGRVITDSTPNTLLEGVFDIVTTVPVRTLSSPYPAKTTQGTFVINNTATVQYGAVNTIAVTSLGDAPINYVKEFMLMKQCDFYAMEQQLPIVSGLTGTASGNIMSISALSSGSTTSDLNCYTDVHVKYYNAASLPTPPVVVPDNYLWIVHWDSNLTTCATTTMIPYQEATSSTGVTTDTCDVGLDINGAAQDITSGGVEHFLAAALPAGYYVLSIDNYSCPLTVTNAATLLVGDYLFGPYSCAYSSSDIDGSNPLAWCRLADVRRNLDGSIDVLAPNLALKPWH